MDKFSHHEALHMASKLNEAVCLWLVDHPAIKADKERRRLAYDAAEALSKLYHLIGEQSLEK